MFGFKYLKIRSNTCFNNLSVNQLNQLTALGHFAATAIPPFNLWPGESATWPTPSAHHFEQLLLLLLSTIKVIPNSCRDVLFYSGYYN